MLPKSRRFSPNFLSLSIALSLPAVAFANEVAELQDINVVSKKVATKQDNEITGLGKVVKNIQDINKEQILGIRDLTRYDPGIAVVEQGRGATSGYSIRGVDRNRVALLVDGLPQIQSYITRDSKANGGAINEIEYENLHSIEISKGASSAEYGNGALGGAVGFRTKNVSDLITDDKAWGLSSKTAYASKNNQFTQSLGFAGRAGGFEALVQYTHRQGKETEIHPDAENVQQTIERLGARVPVVAPDDVSDVTTAKKWFILKDQCATPENYSLCTPRQRAKLTEITEKVSAKDYTGEDRIAPNPMDYGSKSWLVKAGYRFNDRHYVGGVFEHTRQQYDIQDMSLAAYESVEDYRNSKEAYKNYLNFDSQGVYRTNPLEGVGITSRAIGTNNGYSLEWTKSRYFDERHLKKRLGAEYQYKNDAKDGLIDQAHLSFNRQDIQVDGRIRNLRCSPYPTFDKNCQPSVDKRWSSSEAESNDYNEQHNVVQLNLEKAVEIKGVLNLLSANLQFDRFNSVLRRDQYERHSIMNYHDDNDVYDEIPNGERDGSGYYNNPRIYEEMPTFVSRRDYCDYTGNSKGLADCSPRKIWGQSYGIGFKDHLFFGQYVDLGLGVRYDQHSFKTNDDWTSVGTFKNFSWNSGLTVHPTEFMSLSYRISNGYRVPSFYELFGRRQRNAENNAVERNAHHKADFTTEKALNQEFGVHFNGEFGQLDVAYFHNRYKDLITIGKPIGLEGWDAYGYHNLQHMTLVGINLTGKINWHGVWKALPEGLYSNLGYNRIKAKDRGIKAGYTFASDLHLDTLQPSRYVASLGYDAPSEKWGINVTAVYSKAKNADELGAERYFANGNDVKQATTRRTNHWYTYDVVGYLNVAKHFTLRAGVYNLMNRKYSTWESVRQSSINAVNPQNNRHSASYAASGRNYVLSLEAKF